MLTNRPITTPEILCMDDKYTYRLCKVKNYNCHKNKIRKNEPKMWKNNKKTEAQPKLFGSYLKRCTGEGRHWNETFYRGNFKVTFTLFSIFISLVFQYFCPNQMLWTEPGFNDQ